MKFRASLLDRAALVQMLQSLEKFGTQCYVILDPEQVQLVMTTDLTTGSQVFARAFNSTMFSELVIESRAENQIIFITHISNLLKALRVGERASRIVLRLTKREGQAYLTFDMTLPVMESVQDVPVVVQNSSMIEMCERPDVEAKPDKPVVKIRLPDTRSLRVVVDRMAGISDKISIEADPIGDQVIFSVHNGMCEIRTFYNDLVFPPQALRRPRKQARRARGAAAASSSSSPPPARGNEADEEKTDVDEADEDMDDDEDTEDEEEQAAASRPAVVQLKIRRFQRVLSCHLLHAVVLNAYLVPDFVLVLVCRLADNRGSVQYFVPVLSEE